MGGGPVGGDGNLQRAIEIFGEELDNYLQAIRATREKHRITQALVRALQERVLSDGLAAAVRILSANIGFRRLLIAIRAEQSDDAPVHVEAYEGGGVCTLDTLAGAGRVPGASTLDNHVESEARAYLRGESRQLLDRFGFRGAQEEVLIHGVKETTVVGKVVVEAQNGSFNTHDRDLLASFGAFVCQRIVDFNKEYRTLARSFRADDVDRMLRVSDYVDRYLTPRERTVAMLYVDISGFTRISEQVLVDPARIGRLVDVWGSESVRLVHEHGGVFDKMVGDCVIGLFGPPFYDTDAPERLRCAMRAALAIRKMTADLPEREEFSVLRAEGLAVSTGVHLAPLFVGLFGPNENFTGFSSGMNNTARLQGQAGRNEILVMESAVAQLGPHRGFAFGELREGKAKNVADPLRFLPLIGPE
jgi:class 3 adenylate cyclase